MNLDKFIKLFGVVLFLFAVIAAISVYMVFNSVFPEPLEPRHELWGQWGDYFGGTLNPILGFFTLLAILITLFVQSRELSQSTDALKEQSNHLKTQAFENTLFTMLRMIAESVRDIYLEQEASKPKGRQAIKKLYSMLKDIYVRERKEAYDSDEGVLLSNAYMRFSNNNSIYIDHYLRTFDELYLFIEGRAPSSSEVYWGMVKAQMSSFEVLFVFYHCLVSKKDVELHRLKAVNFFDAVNLEMLLDADMHQKFIEKG